MSVCTHQAVTLSDWTLRTERVHFDLVAYLAAYGTLRS